MNSISDRRWHEIKASHQRAIFWENTALQLKAERDFLRRENERLSLTIAERDRQLTVLLGDQPDITTSARPRGAE